MDKREQTSAVVGRNDASRLLEWYEKHRRTLPWRRTSDPFRILLSEVMLQQTQVIRVIPYFESFCARFPDVESLAAATSEEVEAAWSGLGYYRRARQLHSAAKVIVEGDGLFPRSAQELIDLPGIGPYTAAAVASIAFGECVPVLDGNVERVLSRRLAFAGNPKTSAGRRVLEVAALDLLDRRRPGDSNQALMEIGATICKPLRPRCGKCPLATGCKGRTSGRVEDFPRRLRKRPTEAIEISLVLAKSAGDCLVFKRGRSESLLAGQWELPTCEGPKAQAQTLELLYGGLWRIGAKLGEISHTITYRAITASIYSGEYRVPDGEVKEGPPARWVDSTSLSELPVSSLVVKVLERFDFPQLADLE